MGCDDQPGNRIPDLATFSSQIARRLQVIYKADFTEGMVNRILGMTTRQFEARSLWDERDVVLITYGNSLHKPGEKPLRTLHRFMHNRLADIINCVHILPFFPSTSDDGFSVSDFRAVNPAFGDWEDIAVISKEFDLMADLVINHVSVSHQWFSNYLADRNPGRNFFIEPEPDFDYSQVIRPRSTPLFTRFETVHGVREVWTTFSADQVDLNFSNPDVLIEMIGVLLLYLSKGARIVRLDAIAFLWKTRDTSCLHRPETHEIVKLLRDIVSFVSPGTLILTETNVPNRENWSYFGNGDEAHMVYQFALPPLLLHALHTGSSKYLNEWALEIPATPANQTFLNYTASHDGIGIRPLEGLLPEKEITQLIDGMMNFGGRVSNKVNRDGSLSPYEINITYPDAMKGDKNGADDFQEARFICSQTIMMSLQGIPAFYINSLVGTANDDEGVAATGKARSINRRQWLEDELLQHLSSDTIHHRLFHEITRLIGIRRQCPAFHPGCPQKILIAEDCLFAFERFNASTGDKIVCISNISNQTVEADAGPLQMQKGYDLISGETMSGKSDRILLKAYQTKWIVTGKA